MPTSIHTTPNTSSSAVIPPSRRAMPPWLPAVLGAVAALAVYSITLNGSYFYDDTILKEDPRFAHLDRWREFWTQDYMPNAIDRLYRPLTCMTFAVEFYLHGDRPWVLHLVNVLLHSGAAAATAELARRLGRVSVGSASRTISAPEMVRRKTDPPESESTSSIRIASAAGVLFAVHPIHVEAVAGLVGRAELLCTLATLSGLILFLKPMTILRASAIVACSAIALLSKEQGILFPAMLLAITPYRRQKSNILSTSDNVELERGAMAVSWAAICLVTGGYLIFREQHFGFGWDRRLLDWPVNPLVRSKGMDKIFMPLTLLGRYMALLLAPTRLSLDYGARVIGWTVNWRQPYVYIGAIALVAWIVGTISCIRGRRWGMLFCLLAFALSYGLVSNAFILIGTIFGERLMYMPSVFFLILLAALFNRLLGPRLFAAAIVTLAMLGSVRAFTYARLCNDPPALYLANLRSEPDSMSLHGLVFDWYMSNGKYLKARAVGGDCLERLPDCWQSYMMCVVPDLKLHDFADAERVLSHVDRRCPPGMISPLWSQVKAEREAYDKELDRFGGNKP